VKDIASVGPVPTVPVKINEPGHDPAFVLGLLSIERPSRGCSEAGSAAGRCVDGWPERSFAIRDGRWRHGARPDAFSLWRPRDAPPMEAASSSVFRFLSRLRQPSCESAGFGSSLRRSPLGRGLSSDLRTRESGAAHDATPGDDPAVGGGAPSTLNRCHVRRHRRPARILCIHGSSISTDFPLYAPAPN